MTAPPAQAAWLTASVAAPAAPIDREERTWLPGLDGLRAVAVIAVLLFHADLGLFAGGFLGVDVFFVISGFLITTLLLREHAKSGRIDLPAFWRRRARRLLPALFLLLAGVVGFAVVVMPEALARLRIDVLAALAYVTNWHLIFSQQSYFEAVGRPSLLRHLWSLAVEEQFYLAWPVLLAVALFVVRRRGAMVLTVVVAAASIIWTAILLDPEGDPSRVYYGTDTRLFGLLVGGLLAFWWTSRAHGGVGVAPSVAAAEPAGRRLVAATDVLGAAGLGVLVWAFLAVDQFDGLLYPWGAVAVALVAAGVIGAAVQPTSRLGRVLDIAPMAWLGRRSYGIYLWHWPVFVVTRPDLDVPLTSPEALALRLGVTLVLAELSYRLVEMPIRRGALTRFGPAVRGALRGGAWARAGTLASSAAMVIVLVAVTGRVIAAAPPAPPDSVSSPAFAGVVGAAPATASDGVDPSDDPADPGDPGDPADLGIASTGGAAGPDGEQSTDQVYGADDDPTASDGTSATDGIDPTDGTSATDRAETTDPADGTTPAPPSAGPTATPRPTKSPARPSGTIQSASASPSPATASAPSAPGRPAPTAAAPTATPAPTPRPKPVIRANIYAIGDSVLLGAARQLGQALGPVEVDATIGRQMSTVIGILQERRAAHALPGAVIVHIGNNGPLTVRQVHQLFDVVSGVPHVILLTLRVSREWQDHNNRLLVQIARDHSNVRVVDWFAASAGRSDLFWKDGEHVRPEGAQVYARLIRDALRAEGVATR